MLKYLYSNSLKVYNNLLPRTMSTAASSSNYPHLSAKIFKVLESHLPKQSPELDPSTLSNYYDFKVHNSTLDLSVVFEEKKLKGSVSFDLELLNDQTKSIILDSSFLKISSVLINSIETPYELRPRQGPLGSPFVISLNTPFKTNENITLTINYETTDNCTALQWLDPPQTNDGKLPYLFSQCEPIHARSFFPCFDTPSVKSPFTYLIKSKLNILVSGLLASKEPLGDGSTLYKYTQPVPIPSYLVSIASGDIVGASIGPRSTVYSEKSFIDQCQFEFQKDTENFIQTAEKIVFKYEWKDYDVLILPQSMPFGGMEHPNCTFATPTLISGDRENVDVIAHELAHSWSGNLVTNCSFEHFWLNEGWTVYLERRIVGSLHGEQFRHFSAIVGWTDLDNSIKAMGDSAGKFSTLIQDLKGKIDPDDSFSTVPYEKGFNLLFEIETKLGGYAKFDPFIKYYFNKFKYGSLDSYQFLDTLYEFYQNDKEALGKLDEIDWQVWLYEPGLPPRPKFDTTLVSQCYQLSEKWVDTAIKSPELLESIFSKEDVAGFGSIQNGVFLDDLLTYEGRDDFKWNSETGQKAIHVMSKKYSKYANSTNAEVVFRWFRLLLTGEIKESYVKLADWLGTVGRMKFVRPSFVLLNKVDRPLALATFKKYEFSYHPICRAMVKKDLGIN